MKFKKTLLCCLFAWITSASFGGELKWEFLPSGRPFPLTFADPREVRMALLVQGDNQLSALVGNYFSLVALEDEENDFSVHFGIEGAGYFGMRQNGTTFPLEHTDGLLGTYFDGRWGQWRAQLRFTHISAHLSDGINADSITYSREFLNLRAGYQFNSRTFVYAGAQSNVHSIPDVSPLALQLGAYWFSALSFAKLSPFIATDVRWKQESAYNPSLSLQVGLALNNPPESYRSFRLFYAYYTGADPRGQFYTNSLTSHSLGIEMQI